MSLLELLTLAFPNIFFFEVKKPFNIFSTHHSSVLQSRLTFTESFDMRNKLHSFCPSQ